MSKVRIEINGLVLESPEISESEKTLLVNSLLGIIEQLAQIVKLQSERINKLEDEVARLKGQKGKPNIKPSSLSQETKPSAEKTGTKKTNWHKCAKTAGLEIDDTKSIPPQNLPEGSKFINHKSWVVQNLEIKRNNIKYQLQTFKTPDGKYLTGELPEQLKGSHFGPELRAYLVYLHASLRVPQTLILEHLLDLGIKISAGQIDNILNTSSKLLQSESKEILQVGLSCAQYIAVDDTGARHQGKNGFCTQIGGDFFTYFCSTNSKSRINFLEILQAGNTGYLLNDFSRQYLEHLGVKDSCLEKLPWGIGFEDKEEWNKFLISRKTILRQREITEAALLGYATDNGLSKDLLILSDDAGQFNILNHALCWYHAERPLLKLIPVTDENIKDLEFIRNEFWQLYQKLKKFKISPNQEQKKTLICLFDKLVSQKTSFHCLNSALQNLEKNKQELLLVLEYPCLPLHNNGSEREIREYVTRRKISAGTRSNHGRIARDTFLTIKKTLRKLNISFWKFLLDRTFKINSIPSLASIVRQRYLHTQQTNIA